MLQELRLLRERVDRIERILEFIVDRLLPEEEMSDEDREALREALEEHRRGETVPLEELLKLFEHLRQGSPTMASLIPDTQPALSKPGYGPLFSPAFRLSGLGNP